MYINKNLYWQLIARLKLSLIVSQKNLKLLYYIIVISLNIYQFQNTLDNISPYKAFCIEATRPLCYDTIKCYDGYATPRNSTNRSNDDELHRNGSLLSVLLFMFACLYTGQVPKTIKRKQLSLLTPYNKQRSRSTRFVKRASAVYYPYANFYYDDDSRNNSKNLNVFDSTHFNFKFY